ncbi:MAG: hypothetical protein Kow0037_09290 [Calditrichia bacterium]
MWKRLKKITAQKIILTGFAAITIFLLVFVLLYNFTTLIEKTTLIILNRQLGQSGRISFDRLDGNLLGDIRIHNIEFSNETIDCRIPVLSASYSLGSFFSGLPHFSRITIVEPSIVFRDSVSSDFNSQLPDSQVIADTLEVPIDPQILPTLQIDELILTDGVVNYDNIKVDSLYFKASLNISKQSIQLKQHQLSGRWQEKGIHLTGFSYSISGDRKRWQINQVEAEINHSRLYAHAEIEFDPKFRVLAFLDTSTVDLALINKLVEGNPYQNGSLKVHANLIGSPQSFRSEVFLSGQADSLRIRQFYSEIQKKGDTFRLPKFRLLSNAGIINGKALFSPGREKNTWLSFQNVQLEKTGLVNTSTHLNGALKFDFSGRSFNDLDGRGELLLSHCRVDSMKFDSLLVNLSAKKGKWHLQKGSRLVLGKDSKFFVNGTLDKDKTLFVNLSSDKNNLTTLDKKLNLKMLKGVGSLDVVVGGRIDNPDLFGYVLLDSLQVSGVKSYGVEGRFELIGVADERIGYFKLDLLSGKVGNTEITDGMIVTKIIQDTVFIDSVSFDNYENTFITTGKITYQQNGLQFVLNRFDLHYEDYLLHPPQPIEGRFADNKLFIENFYLIARNAGEIEIRGETDFKEENEIAIYLRNISLGPINQLLNSPDTLSGKMGLEVLFSGSLDNPEIEINGNFRNVALGQRELGNLNFAMHFLDSTLNMEKIHAELSGRGEVSISGNLALPRKDKTGEHWLLSDTYHNRLNFLLKDFYIEDYLFLTDINYPLQGRISADINLSGTYFSPLGKYKIDCDSLVVKDLSLPEGHLEGRINPSQILVDKGMVNLNGSEISFAGVKGISWDPLKPDRVFSDLSIRLAFKVEEDSLKFLSLLSPELELLTGNVFVSGKIAGTVERPKLYDFQASVNKGNLYLSKLENPITDIDMELGLTGNIVRIKKLSARSTRLEESGNIWKKIWRFITRPLRSLTGTSRQSANIHASGEIDISDLYRPKLNLTATLENAYFNYFLENTRVWVSSDNLTISGRDTITINGDLHLQKGEIGLDLEESEKNLLLITTIREKPPYIAYNLHLEIPGNVFVRSESNFNSFNMQLSGDLWVTQKPHELLEMTGAMEIFSGGQYFQFEEFTIQKGEIRFPNPNAYPEIDLEAQKRKYGYVFVLHVSGPLNNPTKEIRILDGTTYEDKTYLYPGTKDQISMLLFGVTFNELGQGALLEKGQEVLQQTVMNRIEREARRFIGVDQIKIVKENSQSSLNKDLGGTSLSLGKYLTPKLFLEYRTRMESAGLPGLAGIGAPRLNWEAGNQLFLEYRINRNWSVSTYYEKQENDIFKIDLSWRYEF